MIEKVNENSLNRELEWIDLIDPTQVELEEIAEKYSLHKMAVKDCLFPHHLPKYEKFSNALFVIVRAFDFEANAEADSVRKLTRKIAIFIVGHTIITIHRQKLAFVDEVKRKISQIPQIKRDQAEWLVINELLHASIRGYEKPLHESQLTFDAFEASIFSEKTNISLRHAYVLLRKISVIKRMLTLFLNVVHKMDDQPSDSMPFFNDMREDAEHLLAWASDLFENINRVLQLQISLEAQRTNHASQKTNETVRFLTLFSVFFMPLNFIAGVYGMNFSNLPMLERPYGFWVIVLMMCLSTLVIFVWFRRKKWLG